MAYIDKIIFCMGCDCPHPGDSISLIIALEYAAIYQDDIFGVADTQVTQGVISNRLPFPSIDPIMNPELTIHIENGDIRESDRNSKNI